MSKYRLRLKSGRVIGPFVKEQVGELYEKGHINGSEYCQFFPSGDWRPMEEMSELLETISKHVNKTKAEKSSIEETFLKRISDLGLSEKKEINLKPEPLEEHENPSVIEIENKEDFPAEFRVSKEEVDNTIIREKAAAAVADVELKPEEHSIEGKPAEEKSEKTIVSKFPIKELSSDVDKTIVNVNTKKYLEQLKADKEVEVKQKEEEDKIEEEEQAAQKELEEEEVSVDNATQMINFEEIRDKIKTEVDDAQVEMAESVSEKSAHGRDGEQKESEIDAAIEGEEPKKKSKLIFMLILVLAAAYFLIDDKEKIKTLQPIPPTFPFPQELQNPNAEKSTLFFKKGSAAYKRSNYRLRLKAARFFRESLAHKFDSNPALGMLLLTYSQLLSDSTNEIDDGNSVFKLLQITENKALTDKNVAMGRALFFTHFGKNAAAKRELENFLRVNKPNLEFLGVYLCVLIKSGDMVGARKVLDKVKAAKRKPLLLYSAISDFYLTNDNYAQAAKILKEGLSANPNSVEMMLGIAKIYIYQENFEGLKKVLILVKKAQSEQSIKFYAKFLEYRGLLFAYNQKIEQATLLFEKALKVKESAELRSKLASLYENADGRSASTLILESKSIDLMQKAENAAKEGKWEVAMATAIEAVDLTPNYVEAKLLLARLQVRRGFYDQAIKGLLALHADMPKNVKVNYALAKTYVSSYKFNDVKKYLNIISSSNFKNTALYSSVLADMYLKQKGYLQALKHMRACINRNAVNDHSYYTYALLLIKLKKFKKAQAVLNKAIALDPSNIDYKVANAKILYEQGTDVSLGYLREALEEFPQNHKLLGEIAINYYRSGQIKFFESTMEILQSVPEKSADVYKYLIKSSMMEEKFDDMIRYSYEYLNLEPGDLVIRMQLGEIFLNLKRYKDALKNFNIVKERLPTYPRLLFFISKIWLQEGNTEKAIEIAKQEVEANPGRSDGYILLGNVNSNIGEHKKALKYFEKAQQINPNSVDALVGLASMKYRQNHAESALDLYAKASKLDPHNPFIHKQMGHVYRALGQGALAVESFTTYLDLDPDAIDKIKIEALINNLR